KKRATVKNGKFIGVKAGNTKVTAKVAYKKGKKKVSKTFTVKVKVTSKSSVKATKTPAVTANVAATAVPTATPKVIGTPGPAPTGKLSDSNLTEEHTSRNGITTRDNGIMRSNLSAQDITSVMGMGWNVGNSLEQTLASSCTDLSPDEQAALTDADWVTGYETNAANPVSTQALFDGLKGYGINTIRIPVAWTNLMTVETQADGSKFYRINNAYFNRVEEVMNYALNNEMYVIINIHWDNGWWGMFGDADLSVRQDAWKKYEDFWTQIANRYMEYSDRLIFEGGNEELGERLNDDWRGGSVQTGTLTQEETYALTNQINQKFVDIVRGTGVNVDGTRNNNYYRMLLIPGYDTNLHQTCGDKYSDKAKTGNDKLTYTMPIDVADNGISRLFVSIHYYDPLGWGIAKTTISYETPKGLSEYQDTWGSEADYAAMQEDFDAVKEAYLDKGYGVIFGEFGVLSTSKDGIPEYHKEFFSKCKEYGGMVPVMWDEGTYVDRTGSGNKGKIAYFVYEDIGKVFSEITGMTPTLSTRAEESLTHTGIPQDIVAENQDPLVVATWEGDFMRNTNGSLEAPPDYLREVFGDEFVQLFGEEGKEKEVGGIFRTNQITYNQDEKYAGLTLTPTASSEWWHSHFELSDWKKLEKPCMRITMHNDDVSQTAQLQMGYSAEVPGNGGSWRYDTTYEQVIKDKDRDPIRDEDGNIILADSAWIGKALMLDTKVLENYPVLIITTNDYEGVDFQKIEFCDAAYNADGTPFQSAE
ncbi:MAG: glycoside hydrolase family 5 protein, partial [Lachnospiraceae bacterium]|nr:glycoside hydrolase family 5 protein [Lachnospiraceae bacterium]